MSRSLVRRKRVVSLAVLAPALCMFLQACNQAPRAPEATKTLPPQALTPQATGDTTPPPSHPISAARTPGEYRLHAARHVYEYHAPHLYSGPLPPLLQAVGVLNIEIGTQGEVRGLNWLRAPTHVPEVMRQIEQLVHRAAPYPAPLHLPGVTYTDTWLWHQSGRFQLHTLSEGQLGEVVIGNAQESKRRATPSKTSTQPSTLTAKCKQPASPPGQVSGYC